jgi:hypothetical protein
MYVSPCMLLDTTSSSANSGQMGSFVQHACSNDLAAVLTCGVTGIKAGLSHSPVSKVGRLVVILWLIGAAPDTAPCAYFSAQNYPKLDQYSYCSAAAAAAAVAAAYAGGA